MVSCVFVLVSLPYVLNGWLIIERCSNVACAIYSPDVPLLLLLSGLVVRSSIVHGYFCEEEFVFVHMPTCLNVYGFLALNHRRTILV